MRLVCVATEGVQTRTVTLFVLPPPPLLMTKKTNTYVEGRDQRQRLPLESNYHFMVWAGAYVLVQYTTRSFLPILSAPVSVKLGRMLGLFLLFCFQTLSHSVQNRE